MDSILKELESGIYNVSVTYKDGSVAYFECTANSTILRNRGLLESGAYNITRNRKLSSEELEGLQIVEDGEVRRCSILDEYINKGL